MKSPLMVLLGAMLLSAQFGCSSSVESVDLSEGRLLHELNGTEATLLCDELHNGHLIGEWLYGGVQTCDNHPVGTRPIFGHSACVSGLLHSQVDCAFTIGEWRECWEFVIGLDLCPPLSEFERTFCMRTEPRCYPEL